MSADGPVSGVSAEFPYRYQVLRDGERVGTIEAEYHGRARWWIEHPAFVDPGEPRTMERLDQALYARGFEVMPDD